jgi:hypothetical protein
MPLPSPSHKPRRRHRRRRRQRPLMATQPISSQPPPDTALSEPKVPQNEQQGPQVASDIAEERRVPPSSKAASPPGEAPTSCNAKKFELFSEAGSRKVVINHQSPVSYTNVIGGRYPQQSRAAWVSKEAEDSSIPVSRRCHLIIQSDAAGGCIHLPLELLQSPVTITVEPPQQSLPRASDNPALALSSPPRASDSAAPALSPDDSLAGLFTFSIIRPSSATTPADCRFLA